jgi:hypothetical protein
VLQLQSVPAENVKESWNGYPTDDLQVAANRTGAYSLCGPLVSSIFSVATGCRGAAGRTRLEADHTTWRWMQRYGPELECKAPSCANELTAKVPDLPHSLEESPGYQVPEGMIELPSSPPITVRIGSKSHLDWLRENGEISAPTRR